MNEKPTKTPVKVIITPCDPKIAESDRTKERFEIFQKKLFSYFDVEDEYYKRKGLMIEKLSKHWTFIAVD